MPSIFTKIINGELPAYKVAEDEQNIAFLDINPLKRGHTLVIPKKETDKLFDLDEKDFLSLQRFARKVAIAIEQAISCKRIGVVVLGLEVPHAHIHLIPIDSERDIEFSRSRVQLSEAELKDIALKIQQNFTS